MKDDDDKRNAPGDGEAPADAAEQAAARALAEALERPRGESAGRRRPSESGVDPDDLAAAAIARAGLRAHAPLDDLGARRVVRAALVEVAERRRGAWRRGAAIGALALAAAAMVVLMVVPRPSRDGAATVATTSPGPALPRALSSRPAGRLVPGPFPASQSPAERLDRIAGDRLVAFRELRFSRRRSVR